MSRMRRYLPYLDTNSREMSFEYYRNIMGDIEQAVRFPGTDQVRIRIHGV